MDNYCHNTQLNSLFSILVIILAFAVLSSCGQNQKGSGVDHGPTLREAIEAFNKAYREFDIPTLDAMTTVAYQHTSGSTETMIRKDWLRWNRYRRDDNTRGKLSVEKYDLTDMIIDFYDDAAVVTGTIERAEYVNSVKEHEYFRTTQLWVKNGDQWKRAAYHDVKIR